MGISAFYDVELSSAISDFHRNVSEFPHPPSYQVLAHRRLALGF